MIVLLLLAQGLFRYILFCHPLLLPIISLSFSLILVTDFYMVNPIRFIYLLLQFVPFLGKMDIKILLLHIRVLLLDLLDPIYDLRLKDLFLNGADHMILLWRLHEISMYWQFIDATLALLAGIRFPFFVDITLAWRCEYAGWPAYVTDKPGIQ
jgi:hypothetical protein